MNASVLCAEIGLLLSAGGAMALAAPSGSGKSTILREISGARTTEEARLLAHDADVFDHSGNARHAGTP